MENGVEKVKESIIIALPPNEVYRFWRQLENLPLFMEHLQDVEKIDSKHYHWKTKGPIGSVEWDAVITEEQENKFISWKTIGEPDVENAGSVWFTEWQNVDGSSSPYTHLEVELSYKPPFGVIGKAVATLFGENPKKQVRDDLQKLKEVLESNNYSSTAPKASVGKEEMEADLI